MVTKGIITKLNSDNTIEVRIPLFESPGNIDYQLLDCTICYEPGSTNGYKIDDIVWIGFENNQINKPIILGKLYIGEEEATSLNYINSLEVTNKAILPANTKIGTLDFTYFKELGQKLEETNNSIESIEFKDNDSMPIISLRGGMIESRLDENITASNNNKFKISISIVKGNIRENDRLQLCIREKSIDRKNSIRRRVRRRYREVTGLSITKEDLNNNIFTLELDCDDIASLYAHPNTLIRSNCPQRHLYIRLARDRGKSNRIFSNIQPLFMIIKKYYDEGEEDAYQVSLI